MGYDKFDYNKVDWILQRKIWQNKISIRFGWVKAFVMYMKTCVQRLPSGPKRVDRWSLFTGNFFYKNSKYDPKVAIRRLPLTKIWLYLIIHLESYNSIIQISHNHFLTIISIISFFHFEDKDFQFWVYKSKINNISGTAFCSSQGNNKFYIPSERNVIVKFVKTVLQRKKKKKKLLTDKKRRNLEEQIWIVFICWEPLYNVFVEWE